MPREEDPYVDVDVTVYAETEKAILIGPTEPDAKWIPKSQVEGAWPAKGDSGGVSVKEWIARKQGLI